MYEDLKHLHNILKSVFCQGWTITDSSACSWTVNISWFLQTPWTCDLYCLVETEVQNPKVLMTNICQDSQGLKKVKRHLTLKSHAGRYHWYAMKVWPDWYAYAYIYMTCIVFQFLFLDCDWDYQPAMPCKPTEAIYTSLITTNTGQQFKKYCCFHILSCSRLHMQSHISTCSTVGHCVSW